MSDKESSQIKINLSKALPIYEAHLVPCIINYDGSTSELANNFKSEALNKTTNGHSTPHTQVKYIRGRKMIGEPVEISSNKNDESFSYIIDKDTNKIEYKVQKLYNYEREGNSHRLGTEMEKMNEFVNLMNTIMNDEETE